MKTFGELAVDDTVYFVEASRLKSGFTSYKVTDVGEALVPNDIRISFENRVK